MVNVALALLLLIITGTSFAQSAAGTEIANISSWLANAAGEVFAKGGSGDTVTRDAASRTVSIKTPVDYRAASGRVFNLLVEKTAQVSSTRMGSVVIGAARGAVIGGGIGAVAMLGVAGVALLCQETSICQKPGTDDLEVPANTGLSGQEQQILGLTGWVYNGTVINKTLQQILSDRGCGGSSFDCVIADILMSETQLVATYNMIRKSDGANIGQAIYNKLQDGYTLPPPEKHAPTAEDWAAAESKIASPDWDQILIDKGVPIPTTKPLLQPMTQILSDDTTTDRDSAGNVTGTTKTVTTVTLNDTATDTRPGSVSATETTVKTTSNAAGETTGTQTTTITAPPPDKPLPPINIIMDTVEDTEIQTQTIEAPLNTTSWGEGTCPAPIPISTSFNTYTIPTEQLCDFASGVRPMVLLVASVTALFIVTGFKL